MLLLAAVTGHPQPTLLVFFTHHRPHLAIKDMIFFEKAKADWIAEEVVQTSYQVCKLPNFPYGQGLKNAANV